MSGDAVHDTRAPSRAARETGAWLLWGGVLGGTLAWAVHLLVVWSVVEVTCRSGATEVLGIPVRTVAAAATALPAVLAVAALLLTWRLHRAAAPAGDRSLQRAALMASVGLWLNAFAVLGIGYGAVAVAVLPVCGP